MDDARVDRRHRKRRAPGIEIGIELRHLDIVLAGLESMTRRAQGIGIGEFLAQGRVGGGLLGDVDHAGDGAAGCAALEHFDAHLYVRAGLSELPLRVLLQEVNAHVRGHRIETAAMHDARAGVPGGGLVLVDHAFDPLHFAGEVAVIGTAFGTDLDQRLAEQCIRPDR